METVIVGVKRFMRDEEGVTMVEYGLLAALISIVVLGMVTQIGTHLNTAFQTICTALSEAVGGAACA